MKRVKNYTNIKTETTPLQFSLLPPAAPPLYADYLTGLHRLPPPSPSHRICAVHIAKDCCDATLYSRALDDGVVYAFHNVLWDTNNSVLVALPTFVIYGTATYGRAPACRTAGLCAWHGRPPELPPRVPKRVWDYFPHLLPWYVLLPRVTPRRWCRFAGVGG